MLPETSTFRCTLHWKGNNREYDSFPRVHRVGFPGGVKLVVGGAHLIQDPVQTNPEELFAASVATCMMMTILAVFSKSRIEVLEYEDTPEATLQLVDRRFRVTKVLLRPRIAIEGTHEADKLEKLIQKSHANCFITLSVTSEVVVEPTFVAA
ncbi:OsmC family protein [bacterium]|nr:OsmC family protein [bacterium]MBU1983944.1 OsmC family protein [bacterium]